MLEINNKKKCYLNFTEKLNFEENKIGDYLVRQTLKQFFKSYTYITAHDIHMTLMNLKIFKFQIFKVI